MFARITILVSIFLLPPAESVDAGETAVQADAVSAPEHVDKPVELSTLHAYIESSRDAWDVPGLGIAVVRDDEVLIARGYGQKRFDDPDPVDAHTLFAIGSTTKAFTSTAVAMLVDEGVLSWDDPVTDHLSGFVLKSPNLTGSLTLRDLLAHRSGLPMANLMWLSGLHDSDGLIERLRHLQPVAGIRESFTYQNLLYLAAGLAIESATGEPWARFVSRRLLEPLGMADTRTGFARLREATNMASPHIKESGRLHVVAHRDVDAAGPAGSIHSSAADMARWLRFQLGAGAMDGRRLVGEATLAETHSPQMLIAPDGPLSAFYPETGMLAYGMGWVLSEYRGYRLVDHAGGIDGMTALVALVPEADIGVAILVNLQTTAPPYWLLYPLLDLLLGAEPQDRSEAFHEIERNFRSAINAVPDRVDGTSPSKALEAYSGRFVSPALGEANILIEDDGLALEFGRLSAAMEHWHHDTYRLDWSNRAWRSAAGRGWLTFNINRSGTVSGFEFEGIPGESWTFTRTDKGTDAGAAANGPDQSP